MSLATIRELKRTVKRLEAVAGKGRRHCAYCRFRLRNFWPDPKKPDPPPEDVLKGNCEFCGSEFKLSLEGTAESEREVARLRYSFTMEDMYTNPKAHALELWYEHRPRRKKARQKLAKTKEKAKNDPNARAFAQLLEDVQRLFAQKRKRLEAKYGDNPFPEHKELIESVRIEARNKRDKSVHAQGLFDLEWEEKGYLICAELEKIIWGNTRPETESDIKRVGREIDELIRRTKEAQELRQAEAKRRNQEFLNRNRASVGLPPLPVD